MSQMNQATKSEDSPLVRKNYKKKLVYGISFYHAATNDLSHSRNDYLSCFQKERPAKERGMKRQSGAQREVQTCVKNKKLTSSKEHCSFIGAEYGYHQEI